MLKNLSLHEIADEVVKRFENPAGTGGGASTPSPQFGYGTGIGERFNSRDFAAPGNAKSPQSSQRPEFDTVKPQAIRDYLDKLSRAELEQLKHALNQARITTEALTLVVGGALVAMNPASWLVSVTIGLMGATAMSFDYFASEIDKRLSQKQK